MTPTTKPFIEISQTEGGQIATSYRPAQGHDPILMGIALASATRTMAASLMIELSLGEEHRAPIQAAIAQAYLNDLKLGDMGEAETTVAQDLS